MHEAVTVVIPVWGPHLCYLHEAVESARQSSVPEVLVIDNASDLPVDVSALPSGSVRVHRVANRLSVGAARNTGLAAARTGWVVFLDADDVLCPGVVTDMLRRAAANPSARAVCLQGADPVSGLRYRFPPRWAVSLSSRRVSLALINSIRPTVRLVGASLISTEAARSVGGFADSNDGEDWAFTAAFCWRYPVLISQDVGFLYRRHPASLTRRSSELSRLIRRRKMVREWLRAGPSPLRAPPGFFAVLALLQYVDMLILRPLRRLTERRWSDLLTLRWRRRA